MRSLWLFSVNADASCTDLSHWFYILRSEMVIYKSNQDAIKGSEQLFWS